MKLSIEETRRNPGSRQLVCHVEYLPINVVINHNGPFSPAGHPVSNAHGCRDTTLRYCPMVTISCCSDISVLVRSRTRVTVRCLIHGLARVSS